MTKLLSFFLFLSLFAVAQKESKQNVFSNAGDAAKMALAKQKLYAGEYVSALNAYREVQKNNPDNAAVNYYVGLCYFNLNQLENAKTNLQKAVTGENVTPESHLVLAKVYQAEENFDKAIDEVKAYQATGTEKESLEEAKIVSGQSTNAKAYMSRPVDVQITNLGPDINSKFDDKNPCISADASKLVFTTRRPEGTNSDVDVEGDGKYFENIYLAGIDSTTRSFGKAAAVAGAINSKAHDACTSISADGKQIFIYYNDLKDKDKRGGSVFVSKVNNGKWRSPESLGKPVNSSYWEGGACVSPDGRKYFFTSERPGGFGRSDIWMVEKKSKTEWSEPVNLGAEINSANDEGGMFLAPDGKTLFFCSNNERSMGSYDIFKSTWENGKWTTPANLGYPINTPAKEGQITLSADARYAYISSDRKGGLGESDIYKIDLANFAILEKDNVKKTGNGLSILKGTIREGYEGYGIPDVEAVLNDASGATISTTSTNETGEYFFTVPGGVYKLIIRKKGFKEINETIEVGKSEKETIIVEKGYLLNKG